VYFNPDVSYLSSSAKDSYKEALFEFEKLINKLESLYRTSFRIKKHYKFKVAKQHYGDLNNEFAISYKKNNHAVRVYDEGKEWLNIDFSSKQYLETETVDSNRAKYDMDSIITPLMNTIRHKPKILSDHEERLLKAEERLLKAEQLIIRQSVLIEKLVEGSNAFDNLKY
jgi:hypothetical protein